MAWVKLDDQFWLNDKTRDVSLEALGLHIIAMSYSGHVMKDGRINRSDLAVISASHGSADRMALAGELTQAGLWDEIASELWQIHDWLDFNESRDSIQERRKADRERKSSFQKGSRRNPGGTVPDSKRPEPEPEPVPITTKTKTRASPKNGSSPPDGVDAFDDAWEHYPRKKERAKALKAWTARIKAGECPDAMLQATIHYAQAVTQNQTEPQYIKHAATFYGPNQPWHDYTDGNPDPPATPKQTRQQTQADTFERMGQHLALLEAQHQPPELTP